MTVGMVLFFPQWMPIWVLINAVQYFSQQLPTFTFQKNVRLYDMTIFYRILPDATKYSYYHLLSYFILIHFPAWVCVKVQFQKDHGGFGHFSYEPSRFGGNFLPLADL